MKFSIVVAIVAETLEDKAVDIAKENGAGGVTLLKSRGMGLNEKKTFFGLTYERAESVLMFILERRMSIKIMKALTQQLKLEEHGNGIIFTLPIEHLAGIPSAQLELFENQIKMEGQL